MLIQLLQEAVSCGLDGSPVLQLASISLDLTTGSRLDRSLTAFLLSQDHLLSLACSRRAVPSRHGTKEIVNLPVNRAELTAS